MKIAEFEAMKCAIYEEFPAAVLKKSHSEELEFLPWPGAKKIRSCFLVDGKPSIPIETVTAEKIDELGRHMTRGSLTLWEAVQDVLRMRESGMLTSEECDRAIRKLSRIKKNY